MASMFDFLFHRPRDQRAWATRALTLMGLNGLVFLDPESYASELVRILGCDSVTKIPGENDFVPGMLLCTKNQATVVAIEGTRGINAWWSYVVGAGSTPLGPAPGRVFSPFAVVHGVLMPKALTQFPSSNALMLTGHSLGAAQAVLLNSELTRLGRVTWPCLGFAVPRYGDSAFRAAMRGEYLTFNVEWDPVPLIPPDPVGAISRHPSQLTWTEAYGWAGGALDVADWFFGRQSVPNLDWLVRLAAANVVPSRSPHNIWYYTRSVIASQKDSLKPDEQEYVELLKRLGLLEPWE